VGGVDPESPEQGDPALVEAVGLHLSVYLGEIEQVLHEIDSPLVHVDLFVIAPTEARPFRTVVTCGMAERPMLPPDGAGDLRRCELFLGLPPDWPMDEEHLRDERFWWPLRLLKSLARFPHISETWLWQGHTVSTSDPPEPYGPGTTMGAAFIAPPILMPDGFGVLRRKEADDIHFFGVIPIHGDELALARESGAEALFGPFGKAGVDLVIDPERESALGRRRRRPFGRR
jgi:hypothetical protein